jgi:hypothetical protein
MALAEIGRHRVFPSRGLGQALAPAASRSKTLEAIGQGAASGPLAMIPQGEQ